MFKMNHFEAQLMVSSRVVDSKVLRMGIQSEYFSDKKAEMANVLLEILDGFSLVSMVWVLMYRHSKFAFLQVTFILNWSKWFLVVDFLTHILLTLLTSVAIPILRKKISICRRWFLFGVSYYVNVQITPEDWSMDNNMVSKICVGMFTTNIEGVCMLRNCCQCC